MCTNPRAIRKHFGVRSVGLILHLLSKSFGESWAESKTVGTEKLRLLQPKTWRGVNYHQRSVARPSNWATAVFIGIVINSQHVSSSSRENGTSTYSPEHRRENVQGDGNELLVGFIVGGRELLR